MLGNYVSKCRMWTKSVQSINCHSEMYVTSDLETHLTPSDNYRIEEFMNLFTRYS